MLSDQSKSDPWRAVARGAAVLDAVAQFVASSGITPGDRPRLCVGRSTVREALKRWQGLGTIERRRGSEPYLCRAITPHSSLTMAARDFPISCICWRSGAPSRLRRSEFAQIGRHPSRVQRLLSTWIPPRRLSSVARPRAKPIGRVPPLDLPRNWQSDVRTDHLRYSSSLAQAVGTSLRNRRFQPFRFPLPSHDVWGHPT
jgi:hypothetical protein